MIYPNQECREQWITPSLNIQFFPDKFVIYKPNPVALSNNGNSTVKISSWGVLYKNKRYLLDDFLELPLTGENFKITDIKLFHFSKYNEQEFLMGTSFSDISLKEMKTQIWSSLEHDLTALHDALYHVKHRAYQFSYKNIYLSSFSDFHYIASFLEYSERDISRDILLLSEFKRTRAFLHDASNFQPRYCVWPQIDQIYATIKAYKKMPALKNIIRSNGTDLDCMRAIHFDNLLSQLISYYANTSD